MMALPQNASESLQNLTALVDDIWYYAGDRSVDVSIEKYHQEEVLVVEDYHKINEVKLRFQLLTAIM